MVLNSVLWGAKVGRLQGYLEPVQTSSVVGLWSVLRREKAEITFEHLQALVGTGTPGSQRSQQQLQKISHGAATSGETATADVPRDGGGRGPGGCLVDRYAESPPVFLFCIHPGFKPVIKSEQRPDYC